MADNLIQIAPEFWNIRGSFRIGGVVDIGTQASLVRMTGGGFLLLDAYEADEAVTDQILALTDGGQNIRAILNLHPFHTVHVKAVHARFPHAILYGSARHHLRAPDLPWADETVDDPACHALFADDLQFSVPAGVDFISDDEKVHFSSVLAMHPASRTLHVDDTLTFLKVPVFDALLGKDGHLRFHPTLGAALERRAGAAAAFRHWAAELSDTVANYETVCAAHIGVLRVSGGATLGDRIRSALAKVAGTLDKHTATYG